MSRHPLHPGALVLMIAMLAPAASEAVSVRGEPVLAPKVAEAVARLRLPGDTPPVAVTLAPVAHGELEVLKSGYARAVRKRAQIGIARSLTPAQGTAAEARSLRWMAADGGYAARFAITSPGAAALRVALEVSAMPEGAELVVFGSTDGRLVGPKRVDAATRGNEPWWTPVTEGETQTVEVFVPPRRDPLAAGLKVVGVSHLVASPADPVSKVLAKFGESGSCNIDAPCRNQASQPYLNASASVARMYFVIGGASYLCTGTLLNDADSTSQIPWFYSANHCFDNDTHSRTDAEVQAIADTLNTFWFYESSACGAATLSPEMAHRTAGAVLYYRNAASDVLFLRLRDAPPTSAYFSGWDANTVPAGLELISLHHPQGDLKKVSVGNARCHGSASADYQPSGFVEVRWSQGTTEPGSSGAGIFNLRDAQYYFRGGLLGGFASCSAPAAPDFYSRFELAFPSLAPYLMPGASASTGGTTACTPTQVYSDLWWNPNESGWGLNLIQHPSNNVFGVWYTYGADRRPLWVVMPGGVWRSSVEFTGTLYTTSGPPYTSAFDTSRVQVNVAGTGTLTFTGPGSGIWSYTVNGLSGFKSIVRQPY